MTQLHFSVVSALVYPFALVVAIATVALWLSASQEYRDVVKLGSGQRWKRHGVICGAILAVVSALSFRPVTHLLTIVGFLTGFKAAAVASLVCAALVALTGWPKGPVVFTLLAGVIGGALHGKGKVGRGIVILSAGLWPPLSWLGGWIPPVFHWHLRALTDQQMSWLVAAIALLAIVHSWLTLWLLEYLAERESRRMGQSLKRLAELLDPVLKALQTPPPNEKLCQAMACAVEAPCLGLTSQGLLVYDTSTLGSWTAGPQIGSALMQTESYLTNTSDVLEGNRALARWTVVLPLHDGEESLGALLFLVELSHPLAAPDPAMRKALTALLSGALNSHRLLRQQAVLDETHYRMLAAQIQPHFLFNSLTSVAAFTLTDPDKAHDLIIDLAHSLRPRFATNHALVSVGEALDVVRAYIAVEQARFGDDLKFTAEVSSQLYDCQIPPMILQPLIENSVRHGLATRGGKGQIELRLQPAGEAIEVTIRDDGSGFSQRPESRGHGVGLANVTARLQSLYGAEHRLQIRSAPGRGCEITFRLPRCPSARSAEEKAASAPARPTAPACSAAELPAAAETVQESTAPREALR